MSDYKSNPYTNTLNSIYSLNDENLRGSLSEAALERSNLFSWSQSSFETLKVFEQAFSERFGLNL